MTTASVTVAFHNQNYNYTTSFNGSYEDAVDYFVGAAINVGSVEDKVLECIGIIYCVDGVEYVG